MPEEDVTEGLSKFAASLNASVVPLVQSIAKELLKISESLTTNELLKISRSLTTEDEQELTRILQAKSKQGVPRF